MTKSDRTAIIMAFLICEIVLGPMKKGPKKPRKGKGY